MFANWLRSGWASGRVTTDYPSRREHVLEKHHNWNIIPSIITPCHRFECECQDLCPTGAISKDKTGIQLDRAACIACGRCIAQCPQGVFAWSADIDLAVTRKDLLRQRGESRHDH